MADKNFKVSDGDEIIISIRRRRQDAERIVPYKKRRGIIDPVRFDEFLPRRLGAAATGWRIYDLGQELIDGEAADILFEASANIAVGASGYTTGDVQSSDFAAKAAFYTDYIETLRAEAADELTDAQKVGYIETKLKERFLQITQTNGDLFTYRVQTGTIGATLDSSNPRWQNGAIKIEETDTLQYLILTGNVFMAQMYLDTRPAYREYGCKVTSEPSFAAAEVTDLVLSKKASLFIPPSFGMTNVFVTGNKTAPTGRLDLFHTLDPEGSGELVLSEDVPFSIEQILVTDYLSFPRNEWIDLIELWKSNLWTISETYGYTLTLEKYSLFYLVAKYLYYLEGTRNLRKLRGVDARFGEDGETLLTPEVTFLEDADVQSPAWEFPVPELFPVPPDLPNDDDYGAPGDWGTPNQYFASWSAATGEGDLQLIIIQDNQIFYVWRR